jgi:hypothetical protein
VIETIYVILNIIIVTNDRWRVREGVSNTQWMGWRGRETGDRGQGRGEEDRGGGQTTPDV